MINLSFELTFPKFAIDPFLIELSPGIHGIYGESGTGKSDFLSLIELKENSTKSSQFKLTNLSNHHYSSFRIRQNPDHQIVGRTLSGELTFNGECNGKSQDELKEIVNDGMTKIPNHLDKTINPGFLSGGEKEILNIITSLNLDIDILLIDDGLSFLSVKNKLLAIDWLRAWCQKGKVVIWATSEYNDMQHCDVGWELQSSSFKRIIESQKFQYESISLPKGKMNLTMEKMDFSYSNSRPIFQKLSINIASSRSLGLVGGNGSGKTTLAGLIFQDLEPTHGEIGLSIHGSRTQKIGYVDQFPEHIIQLNTPSELLNSLIEKSIFDHHQKITFQNRLARFGIQWESIQHEKGINLPWATLRTLSVVLLSQCHYDALILDEPTFGLGWNQRVTLRSFLREMMTKMHFIILSHDRAFVQGICDTIIDMNSLTTTTINQSIEQKTKA